MIGVIISERLVLSYQAFIPALGQAAAAAPSLEGFSAQCKAVDQTACQDAA
jgi:hypothetical protein